MSGAKKPKEAGMKMTRISFKSRQAAAAAVATLAGGLTLAAAGPASAYGNGQVYQVELSANISGPSGGGARRGVGRGRDPTRRPPRPAPPPPPPPPHHPRPAPRTAAPPPPTRPSA